MTKDKKLHACWFCDNDDVYSGSMHGEEHKHYMVCCAECRAHGPASKYEAEAIRMWEAPDCLMAVVEDSGQGPLLAAIVMGGMLASGQNLTLDQVEAAAVECAARLQTVDVKPDAERVSDGGMKVMDSRSGIWVEEVKEKQFLTREQVEACKTNVDARCPECLGVTLFRDPRGPWTCACGCSLGLCRVCGEALTNDGDVVTKPYCAKCWNEEESRGSPAEPPASKQADQDAYEAYQLFERELNYLRCEINHLKKALKESASAKETLVSSLTEAVDWQRREIKRLKAARENTGGRTWEVRYSDDDERAFVDSNEGHTCAVPVDIAGELEELRGRLAAANSREELLRDLAKKVGEHLEYHGTCDNAVDDDAVCDHLGCTYCDMARAHAEATGRKLFCERCGIMQVSPSEQYCSACQGRGTP